MRVGAQKSGGAAALPAPPPPRSLSTKLLGLTLSDTDNGIDDLVEKATIERGHTF